MRELGEFGVVDLLPDVAVVLLAVLTQLADTWFLFALLAAAYWFADGRLAERPRHAGAVAIALVTCALAAVTLGKVAIAAPRPPAVPTVPTWLPGLAADWFSGTVGSDGFGFPSGHATGATVAYGALALVLDRLAGLRRRLGAAALVVVVVALSRVAIRVHYLVDVVVGALLGVVVLLVGLWLAGDERIRPSTRGNPLDPTPVFLLAAAISAGAVAVAVGTGHHESVVNGGIGVGTALGGAVGWRIVDGDDRAVPVRFAVPTLAVTGGVWFGVFTVEPSLPVTVALTTLTVAVVIAAPALATRGSDALVRENVVPRWWRGG